MVYKRRQAVGEHRIENECDVPTHLSIAWNDENGVCFHQEAKKVLHEQIDVGRIIGQRGEKLVDGREMCSTQAFRRCLPRYFPRCSADASVELHQLGERKSDIVAVETGLVHLLFD